MKLSLKLSRNYKFGSRCSYNNGWVKTWISTQAARQSLFIHDCMFINIYFLLHKWEQFYPFIWFCWHGSLQRSQREPGTFWMCSHKYEVDVSIQEIRGRRPAALLSPCDALKLHSCRSRALINPRIKVKEKEEEAWKTRSGPPGCPTDPPSISPHSDTVTNILDGRPWHSCKQENGGGGSVIPVPLLSKDD